MSVTDLLLLLLVAGACGAFGQVLAGSRGGIFSSIGVGLVGALLGMWGADLLGLPHLLNVPVGTHAFPLVWAIVGSALVVLLVQLSWGRHGLWEGRPWVRGSRRWGIWNR